MYISSYQRIYMGEGINTSINNFEELLYNYSYIMYAMQDVVHLYYNRQTTSELQQIQLKSGTINIYDREYLSQMARKLWSDGHV